MPLFPPPEPAPPLSFFVYPLGGSSTPLFCGEFASPSSPVPVAPPSAGCRCGWSAVARVPPRRETIRPVWCARGCHNFGRCVKMGTKDGWMNTNAGQERSKVVCMPPPSTTGRNNREFRRSFLVQLASSLMARPKSKAFSATLSIPLRKLQRARPSWWSGDIKSNTCEERTHG